MLVSDPPTQSDTSTHDSAVAVFDSHLAAEEAVRKLASSGFDMRKLSITSNAACRHSARWVIPLIG